MIFQRDISPETWASEIAAGDPLALSRAITLSESALPADRVKAAQILEKCLPHSVKSLRIGITGAPGVGKSSFIDSFGMYLLGEGKKPAVLAIDPSSERTKGSILGDKTRMTRLSVQPGAFIRPSPAGGYLGGIAAQTHQAVLLCEAAGFDVVLIETVGVGQSEIAVQNITDFLLLLLQPGAGDELQGIKRGIVEAADLLVVNKDDGANREKAAQTAREYRLALHLFPVGESGIPPQVLTGSAAEDRGREKIWHFIEKHHAAALADGFFQKKRNGQERYWLHETIKQRLLQQFYENDEVKKLLPVLEQQLVVGETGGAALQAAEKLLSVFNGQK